ncbi:MAG: hypothetical protein KC493_18095 [Bacteriovoracaceae bacterium]|nr:hypothetical protein [Bacteriovoracaceae bacterium]
MKNSTITLESLLKEKEELLLAFPELGILQREIDLLMAGLPCEPELKIQVLNKLLMQVVSSELLPQIHVLVDKLERVQKELIESTKPKCH